MTRESYVLLAAALRALLDRRVRDEARVWAWSLRMRSALGRFR